MMPQDEPVVSVIVPVFNDATRLSLCLDALERQTPQTVPYEVLVVDNDSDTRQNIPGLVSRFRAVYLMETTPSSYAARNTGLRYARGTVIAFTDADCVPAEDWIEAGYRRMIETPSLGLVAGRIDVTVADPTRVTTVELYERTIAFPQEEHVKTHQFGATANLFTTRQVIERVGEFDGHLKSGGDIEWGQRVATFGYRQAYANDVVVRHPARRTFTQLYRRTIRCAGGSYARTCERGGAFIARQWAFCRSLLLDLAPPVMFAITLRRTRRLHGWRQELSVVAVMVFVRYVSAWEKVKLKFGSAKARA